VNEHRIGKVENSISKEEVISNNSTLSQALFWLKEHRYWSDTTFESYYRDIKLFEIYLKNQGLNPTLVSGEKMNIVNKWIIEQKDDEVAYKTITRRVATLSSLYSFYKEMGVVEKNAFKASRVPGAHSESHSRALDLDDLKLVYKALQELKTQNINLEVPIKLLLFTGLRNHAIGHLRVKDVNWADEVIVYNHGVDNFKHKLQLLPLPPKFLQLLSCYIEEMKLEEDDPLCYGIKGVPLKNKQLNLLVNKINEYLGWEKEMRVTPHGFRYTIATLLDEKGLSIDTIKYLLGHSSNENVQLYLKRDKRKIFQIKAALTEIEEKLESSLDLNLQEIPLAQEGSIRIDNIFGKSDLPFSEEFLIQLSQTNPKLLEKILLEHYLK
jgi:integrase